MLLSVMLYTLGASVAMWTVEGTLTAVPATPFVEWANAAVKARLVERLTTELKQTENTKKTMVTAVKDCQISINQTVDECKECIKEKCLARADSCKVKVDIVQVLKALTSKGIKLLQSAWKKYLDIHVDLANFAKDAIEDIIGGLSDGLESVGKELIRGVQHTLSDLTDTLTDVVESFGDILDGLGDIVGDLKDGLSNVFKEFGDVLEDVGDIVHDWGNELGDIAGDIGDTVENVVGDVGDAVEDIAGGIGDIASDVSDVVGDVVHDVGNTVQDIGDKALDVVSDIGSSVGHAIGKVFGGGGWKRRRRSAEPSCQDLKDNGGEACMAYKFICSSCQKLTAESGIGVLENVCGSGAVTSYNNMIEADQKTKTLLAVYRLYIKLATLLLRLEVDIGSIDPMTASYSIVYATVNVANVNSTYESSAGFSYANATASGTAIGDEVWNMFWDNGVFGSFERSTKKRAFVPSKLGRSDKLYALTHKLQAMAEKGLIRRRTARTSGN